MAWLRQLSFMISTHWGHRLNQQADVLEANRCVGDFLYWSRRPVVKAMADY